MAAVLTRLAPLRASAERNTAGLGHEIHERTVEEQFEVRMLNVKARALLQDLITLRERQPERDP
jgi:hypothetical protein